jgi:hypothetical protein
MTVRLGLLVLAGLVVGPSSEVEAQRTKSIPVAVAFDCAIGASCTDHVRGDGRAYAAAISGTRLVMLLPDDGLRRLAGDFSGCVAGGCQYSPLDVPSVIAARGRLLAYAVDGNGKEIDLTKMLPGQSSEAVILVDFTLDPRRSTWEMWTLRFDPLQRVGSTRATIQATLDGWVVKAATGRVAALEYNSFRTSSPEDRGRVYITFEATVTK